jgi:hypothetical protein
MTDSTDNARRPERGICDFKTVYIVTTYTSGTELQGTPTHFGKYDSDRDARQALADDGFTNGQFGWRKNTYTDATISKSVEYSNHRTDLAPDPLRAVKIKPLEWDDTGVAFVAWDDVTESIVYASDQEEASLIDQKREARILSDLVPDPLADARVKALVKALRLAHKRLIWASGLISNDAARDIAAMHVDETRAALAAFDKGGRKDG